VVNGADEPHGHGSATRDLGDWSGFTIVDRLGAQIELIPHLLGATNRFPQGQRAILYIWRSSLGVTKPNAQLDLLRIAS
jgi:predicted phage gp36 major capsid-like protein